MLAVGKMNSILLIGRTKRLQDSTLAFISMFFFLSPWCKFFCLNKFSPASTFQPGFPVLLFLFWLMNGSGFPRKGFQC